jgi:hypothetical protein
VTATGPVPVRLFYVDDSGAPDTGWIVYSWIECAITDWKVGLRAWLDLRKRMFADHRIPPSYELHAAHLIGGRGEPSTDPAWNRRKRNRSLAMREALATIGDTPVLGVGSTYRLTSARGSDYGRERGEVYAALVSHLDTRCARSGEYGMIFMDGDGSSHSYYAAHRELKLADRHIIEDPLFQVSHRSQWVQMADLTAWTAYHSLIRLPPRRFAWDWYATHLLARDVNGGPVAL